MIVVDPVTLGDASFSGGGGAYWDKSGVLQAGTLGVPRITYDPADLSKPAAVMLEPEAANRIRNNTMQGAAVGVIGSGGSMPTGWNWPAWPGAVREVVSVYSEKGIDWIRVRITGTTTAGGDPRIFFQANSDVPASPGDTWAGSAFLRSVKSTTGTLFVLVQIGPAANIDLISSASASHLSSEAVRLSAIVTSADSSITNARLCVRFGASGASGIAFNDEFEIGLPQLERDRVTSPIKTSGSAVTRSADVVGTTAGLLYSNVPETEPMWVAGTYAKGAKVRDAAHVAWESLVDGNTAALPSKSNANWLSLGATNRHAMFDDRNNTQTSSPEEIIVVLSPRAIAQGLLLGNLDASEIGVSVTVPNYGVVYSQTGSLVVSTSGSSFFRWGFNRIRRKTLFLSLNLPIYFNGVVTVSIRKPGGVPKCGMCLIGPTVEPGPALMGLSTEIKDYSTTSFATDGSSSTIERGYRKLMSMDVSIDTENIVQAEEQMIAWKQKTVAWIGAASRPDTVIVGRYSSFKKVIESYPRSKMALQIEGVLS